MLATGHRAAWRPRRLHSVPVLLSTALRAVVVRLRREPTASQKASVDGDRADWSVSASAGCSHRPGVWQLASGAISSDGRQIRAVINLSGRRERCRVDVLHQSGDFWTSAGDSQKRSTRKFALDAGLLLDSSASSIITSLWQGR